jgi:hypothetical protein
LGARELCAGWGWKIRRVLAGSCRPPCPAGPAELSLSESSRRTAAFRRWRYCADDLGRLAFAVPVADLGDRGHVRSVVCGAPCSRGACRRSCSRQGRPSTGRAPPKAAKRSQVTGRGTPTTSPITVVVVFLPLEHRSAFPACAVQRAFGHSTDRDQGRWRTAKWTANAQRPAGTQRDVGALDQQLEAGDAAGRRVA